MAFLTTNRLGNVKVFPVPFKEGFGLGANQTIFAHSALALGSDGNLYNLGSTLPGGVTILRILYTEVKLAKGLHGPFIHDGGDGYTSYEAQSNIVAYMEATGLTQADNGKAFFMVDDHTITTTGGGGITAIPAGKIQKVVNATTVAVHFDGLMRDVPAA